MKFIRNFTFILSVFIAFSVEADELTIMADSTREKAEEVIRTINAGLNSTQIQAVLQETKVKDFLLRNLETYSGKINSEQGRYLFYFALGTAFFDAGN